MYILLQNFLCNKFYLLSVFDKIFIVLLNEMYLDASKDEINENEN